MKSYFGIGVLFLAALLPLIFADSESVETETIDPVMGGVEHLEETFAEDSAVEALKEVSENEESLIEVEVTAEPEAPLESPDPQERSVAKIEGPRLKAPEGGAQVYVVPVEGPINSPQLYILRRALKEAIENNVDTIVLDMDTPGGELGVTLEMMEALGKFEGLTMTFVNDEAISAGSYISIATDDIYFAPQGIMGAAEAVSGTGEDINESMQRKIGSYLRGKVRAMTDEYRYRGDVQRAMMDPEFEFKIGDAMIKEKGELLSLTAKEATAVYGEPPEPLLAVGIADDIEDLLNQTYGQGNYTIKTFEVTWSEELAKFFKTITPLLVGVGMLLLFIEFKTPTFGVVGGIGIAIILLVFVSNYFAGMAGHEEVIVFFLGVALIGVELFLFPGMLIFGLTGLCMVVGSLIWAMADVWPDTDFTFDLFVIPAGEVMLGMMIAILGISVVMRYLPKTTFGKHLVLSSAVGGAGAVSFDVDATVEVEKRPAIGSHGVTVTALFPTGKIEIDGVRYEAKALHGSLDNQEPIEVVGYEDYSLIVKVKED